MGISAQYLLLFLALTVFAVGCAGVPRTLTPEAKSAIQSTEVRSYVGQDAVNLQYVQSSYGSGGGLIGALIDASIDTALSSSAEARARRIREVVQDYDFRAAFWTAVSNVVAETDWVHLDTFNGIPTDVLRVSANEVVDKALLNLDADYSISPDHRVFLVNVGCSVFVPGQHGSPAAANRVFYHSNRVCSDEGDEAAAHWMANDGAAYRREADEGIAESARMLRHALAIMGGSPLTAGQPASVKADFVHGRGGFGIPVGRAKLKGTILEETEDRIIFQAATGNIFSLPKSEVTVKYLRKA